MEFITVDAATIHSAVMDSLMDGVNEPLYPGDERRIFGEALAAVIISLCNKFNDKAKQRMLQNARGEELDAIGYRYDVERAAPAKAYTNFRFSVETAQASNIIIPAGTKVTTDGSVYFTTDEIAVLQSGSLYVDVPGTCTMGGSAYNGFTAGSISTLVDLIPFVRVANTTPTKGGDDGEPYPQEDGGAGDDRYRERIHLAPSKLSTAGPPSGYRYFALSADADIIDVAIDVPSANVVNIYPLMKGGQLPDEDTLEKVEAAFNDKNRPMTDQVTAMAPEQVEYSVEIKYYCTKDNEAATVKTIEAEGGAIDRYNEWQTAALARDINPDKLRSFILCPNWADGLMGAERVEIVSPTLQTLEKSEVAKLSGPVVVSHEIIK